jgi:hypothetical protein
MWTTDKLLKCDKSPRRGGKSPARVPVTTPACGWLNTEFSRSKLLSLFLTTLYQQNVESGQEHVILLVGTGVVTGSGVGVCKGVGSCVLVEIGIRIKGDSFAL